MKIEVRKTHFFVLLGALILVAGSFFAYGYGTNNPSNFGHSVGEIDWSGDITLSGKIAQDVAGADNSVWIQGGPISATGADRKIALLGSNAQNRLHVNYQSAYSDGTVIGGPLRTGELCLGTNCITSWPVDTNTNAATLCTGDQYLNGNGACRTPAQIVTAGGGGSSSSALQTHELDWRACSGLAVGTTPDSLCKSLWDTNSVARYAEINEFSNLVGDYLSVPLSTSLNNGFQGFGYTGTCFDRFEAYRAGAVVKVSCVK